MCARVKTNAIVYAHKTYHIATETQGPHKRTYGMADPQRSRDSPITASVYKDDLSEMDDSQLQMLPNELLSMIVGDPRVVWASALVCSRWHAIVNVLYERNVHAHGKRVRLLHASSALSTLGHMSSLAIRGSLKKVLHEVTLAHLLPLLVASNNPQHVDYALDMWSDECRLIDDAEAAEWIAAHDRLEARFDAEWPDTVCHRSHLRCDHATNDVHSIASCVLLSVAARHTHQPDTLHSVTRFCRANARAFCKAAYIATAEDRRDALGTILYLYALHAVAIEGVPLPFHPGDSGATTRHWHSDATRMFTTLYVVAGTHGSLECAKTIDLFHQRGGVTGPSAIVSPSWYYENDTMRTLFAIESVDRSHALIALNDIMAAGHGPMMRKRHWIWAAMIADRPEMLDLYSAGRAEGWESFVFASVASLGKRRFCDALMSRFPGRAASSWNAIVNNPDNVAPFAVEGVRWLAAQTWYEPHEGTVLCIINDLFSEKTGVPTTRLQRLCDTIDALGLLVERWPLAVRSDLADQRDRIASLLVSCIMRAGDCRERDLIEVLVNHLDCCALVDTSCSGSRVERAWSYVCDTVAANAMVPALSWVGCDPCVDTPMAIVLGTLLNRYQRTPSDHAEAHGRIRLRPLCRDHAVRTIDGNRQSAKSVLHLRSALEYIKRHDLLTDVLS